MDANCGSVMKTLEGMMESLSRIDRFFQKAEQDAADTLPKASARWSETAWQPGGKLFDELSLAKKLSTEALLREVFTRLSETDAALTEVIDEQESLSGRTDKLQKGADEVCERVRCLEETVAGLKDEWQERRQSSNAALTSSRGWSEPLEEKDKVVVKHLSEEGLSALRRGGVEWLLGEGTGLGAWFRRCWRSTTGTWCAVMEINPHQKSEFLRAAKQRRSVSKAVIVPYLTREGMQVRKARTEVFRSLAKQGQEPKWKDGADICYVVDGKRVQLDVER
ncbi:hypothetical protein HYH03_016303 [Edaphochlamys debaryana]|uniref:Uncharacterized protein n=1 Tax=Edaphochlamys debaryana TaxID=47281 RepID=A0A836BQE1_9CHLO|nr:hypothetical protein HYH03_016303 [Edaphochlamys debaryana]|eukprot:KAG2484917.1 hypothetical protein HYH03_016303 [Edaphochlamys debaryana]